MQSFYIVPGMNHALKEASEDRGRNIATYINANLPLADTLLGTIVIY